MTSGSTKGSSASDAGSAPTSSMAIRIPRLRIAESATISAAGSLMRARSVTSMTTSSVDSASSNKASYPVGRCVRKVLGSTLMNSGER